MLKKYFLPLILIPHFLFCPIGSDSLLAAQEHQRLVQIVVRYGTQSRQSIGQLNQHQFHFDLEDPPEAITIITVTSAEERLRRQRCCDWETIPRQLNPYLGIVLVGSLVFLYAYFFHIRYLVK